MDTTTPEAKQLELETLAVEMGIAAYRQTLQEGGLGAVHAGQQLIKHAMGPMIEAVNGWMGEGRKGASTTWGSLFAFMQQYEPEVIAWCTAQAVISSIPHNPSLATVAFEVCNRLEAYQNMDEIIRQQPRLGVLMTKKLRTAGGPERKAMFVRKGAAAAGIVVVKWDRNVRAKLGTMLVQMFADSTELITVEMAVKGRATAATIRATEACEKWLEESHARCELLTPKLLPMVCKPRPRTNPFDGGYFTAHCKEPMLKIHNRARLKAMKDYDMPWVYRTVNTLQDTSWSVNERVYEVARAVWESRAETSVLPRQEPEAIPPRTWPEDTEPDPDVLREWKAKAAQVYNFNAEQKSKRKQAMQVMWTAEKMLEYGNRFYYSYAMDWRGRLYPVGGGGLTPQGNKLAKGLLHFTSAKPLGDEGAYWLAIHVANCYGIDKVSFADRAKWVQETEEMILRCAEDPYVWRDWQHADSPWCFLAACFEWADLSSWVANGHPEGAFASRIPVAFDGTCNGLQNFSALLRDEIGGAATGLVPSDKPADIYTRVAGVSQGIIDAEARSGSEKSAVAQRWVGKMTRQLAKRNTMTVPYGVTRRGMTDQLWKELRDMKSPAETRTEDALFLAACNYEAIGTVVVAARVAMNWLKEAAKIAASNGLPVTWTTPSGFVATQDYREDVGDRVNFEVMGQRYRYTLLREGDKLDTKKQALGIAPNFIHSLDAAHLMRTVLMCAQDGITDYAMIHDSYGVHAGDASVLRRNLADAFVEQYSEPVLSRFRAELAQQLRDSGREDLAEALPPVPPMGSLDLDRVRESDYFFA